MNRDDALALVNEKVKSRNIPKHMLAVEAIMRTMAKRLNGDEETWGLAGLLHDLDYDLTFKEREKHGHITAEWLKGKVSDEIIEAIVEHPGRGDMKNAMSKALHIADPLSGLITAAALIRPEKKLAAIDANFVQNRFDEKRFSAAVNRDQIRKCEELGIPLRELIALGLVAMQEIASELGL
jgi:putative nucleotidyltransferase with HDIG domain